MDKKPEPAVPLKEDELDAVAGGAKTVPPVSDNDGEVTTFKYGMGGSRFKVGQ